MQGLSDMQGAHLSRHEAGAWPDAADQLTSPLARLTAQREKFRADYAAGQPYPHVVMDGLFDAGTLDRVIADFPREGHRDWLKYDNIHEIKQTSRGISNLSPLTQLLFLQLCSEPFIEQLQYITGIPDLVWDPMFHGAGLHETYRGGWLNLHADWTHHPSLPLARRLNLIVYLNHDWDDAWGGHLDLADPDTLKAGASVAPLFNRAVIFPTTARTPHGFPDPLTCPADRTRKSISVYYWTADLEAVERNYISFLPGSADTRKRALMRSFVPPIMFDVARSLRSKLKS